MKENPRLAESSPIFIVGTPRSGTTLLSFMLSRHSNIVISPETHFLSIWVKRYGSLNLKNDNELEEFWEKFSSDERFSHLGIDSDSTFKKINEAEVRDFRCIFTVILKEHSNVVKKKRWGEKTPAHYENVDTLLSWYPEAKVIWIIRDPRAVTASLLQAPWSSAFTHFHAERWRDCANLFHEKWSKDDRVVLVRYEDLVQKPDTELRKLCDFLSEEYTPDLLEASKESMLVVNQVGWSKQHMEKAKKPIRNDSLDKWRRQLTSSQIGIIEKYTCSLMIRHGYIPVYGGLKFHHLFRYVNDKVKHKFSKLILKLRKAKVNLLWKY
ncbi:MAG: sulfotransferase [Cyanobacteria bacterium J06639_16]